ncbi:MAG: bifunctional phosphoglucose/phosphomannose isomerase [Candidatus Rokubacteria bacterium]|nr:bifunctional phosphoglucose/phosphomannose isomerase [Candidatus Rokubacteria bacterium]
MLDDLAALKRLDPHHAREALAGFPAQCRAAARLRPEPALALRDACRAVVVVGMGGSAAGGDLVAACAAERATVPVLVHRGYDLPALAGPETLVIASSYSGETEEVLAAVDMAIRRGCAVAAITAGGALGALAARHGFPRITLPGGLMPRMALGYLALPGLALLRAAGVAAVEERELAEALDVVETLAAELAPERPTDGNEAKRIARAIGQRIAVIYGGPVTGGVAYRWKTDMEENAKAFAIAGAIPEMNHNEIEAWRPGVPPFHLVLLRDEGEAPAIRHRFAILRDLVGPAVQGVSEVWTRGRGRLARLLSSAYLGQWTSYYSAIVREVDPWTVPILDEIKRRMRDTSR